MRKEQRRGQPVDSLWADGELPVQPYVERQVVASAPTLENRQAVFTYGVALLVEKGQSEVTARRVLGQMVRDHGDAAVLGAVNQAIANDAGEPVSYMKRCLGAKGAPVRPNRQEALEDTNRAVVERMFSHGR